MEVGFVEHWGWRYTLKSDDLLRLELPEEPGLEGCGR